MTRARNIAGFSTITTTPSPVHVGPIGVLTATRIDGEFGVVDITARDITAQGIGVTNLQVSGITTGLNVSGIITAQNGINFNGTSTGLNVSGIGTIATLDVSGNATIGGVLTYEDVTRVDSVGIVTAGKGFRATTGGLVVTAGISTFGADVSIADKIIHTGDTNTAIRFPAADTISAETSGSERMRITSAGVVGINTVGARGATVEIQDIGSTGPTLLLAGATNTEGDIVVPDGQAISVGHWNNSDTFTERLSITSTGLVGIGTISPGGLFHTYTASGTNRNFIEASASHAFLRLKGGSTSYNTGLEFYSGASNIANVSALGSGGITFEVGGSERIRFSSAGAIGIAGANYGSSGQVLTSGGAGSAVSWSTITGTTINNNANNRVITGSGTANTLEGESGLLFDGIDTMEMGTAAGGSGYDSNMKLRIGRANDCQICVRNTGGDTNYGGLIFGDQTSAFSGGIQYYHDNDSLRFKTAGDNERVRITSVGTVNIGGSSGQTTHMLYLQSTGDAGIHIRADSDNSGENDNPYLSMSQDGSASQQLKLGMVGDAGQEFAESIGNASFLHANTNNAQPLQLAHMDNLAVTISNTEQTHFHSFSSNSLGGVKIANRGNDTAAALLLQGHNNTGTPGQPTNTQLTHIGSNLTFEITHAGSRAIHIGNTRRIRLPGVPGVAGSGLQTVFIESDGNLCTTSSLREYKTNITTMSDISWLFNLNPVTFNWKKKTEVNGENVWEDTADNNGTQYGLIAEEVKEVKNDFCYYDNNGDLSGVHYDRMIAPLIKAVQDLKKENDDLKTLIKNSGNFDALKSSL